MFFETRMRQRGPPRDPKIASSPILSLLPRDPPSASSCPLIGTVGVSGLPQAGPPPRLLGATAGLDPSSRHMPYTHFRLDR
eukprot:5086017-Pyramimonas_sp.AAC.2